MSRTRETEHAARRWPILVAPLLIIACGLAAYSNSFTKLYVGLDGKESIRDNPHIRRIWPLSEALSVPLWPSPRDLKDIGNPYGNSEFELSRALTVEALGHARLTHNPMDDAPTVAFRPTFSLSLALTNHFLGDEPQAQHAVNLLIHICAALLLFGIVRRTASLPRFAGSSVARPTWLALGAALIWLVHPLQTEAVTYVVQRAESLMGLLVFTTLYCSIRAMEGRHRLGWQTAAIVACVLGTGAKQTAVFAPLLVLLYDFVFLSRTRTKWVRPFFYVALATPLWVVLLTHGFLTEHSAMWARFEPVRYLSYALAQPGVVLHYLRLFVWPDDLFLYVNTRLFEVQSLAQVLVPTTILVAVFVATIYYVVRRHWIGFVGAWFFIMLGPTSSFFDVSDLIQEHRMYVPLAALSVLAVVGTDSAVRRLAAGVTKHGRAAIEAVLLAVVVLGLGMRTHARNWDYHHEFTAIQPADLHRDYTILADHYLTSDRLIDAEAARQRELLSSPDADARDLPFAHFIIGLAHARDGDLKDAATELRRTVELDPDFAYAHHRLGMVLRKLDDLPGATEQFHEAIRIDPTLVYARKELALTLERAGDDAAAEKQLELALQTQPAFGEGLFELGILAQSRGDEEEAAQRFQEAVASQPTLVEPHYELGLLYLGKGDDESALEHLETTVRLRPDFPEAQKALGMALARFDRLAEARQHLERAIELRPDYADAHNELGIVLRREGDLDAAARHFERALKLDPECPDFHYQLGRLFMEKHDDARAMDEFRIALTNDPDHFHATFDMGNALVETGELSAALPYLEKAAALHPDDDAASRHLDELRARLAGKRPLSTEDDPS
jgi:tetratricopeptide (TPR) repeat protein